MNWWRRQPVPSINSIRRRIPSLSRWRPVASGHAKDPALSNRLRYQKLPKPSRATARDHRPASSAGRSPTPRPTRVRLTRPDRMFGLFLYRLWPRCLDAVVIVKPETVIAWHRKGFRAFWEWKSRPRRRGRPPLPAAVRTLIRRIAREGTVRLKFEALSNRLIVAGNHRVSALSLLLILSGSENLPIRSARR